MLKVTITAPPSRAGMIAQMLKQEGLTVDGSRPIEQRSVESTQTLVDLVYFVGGAAASGVIGDASTAAVRRVIAKLRGRAPDLEAKIEEMPEDGE